MALRGRSRITNLLYIVFIQQSNPCIIIIISQLLCRIIKFLAWMLVIIQSLLIIAARKHYSVDIVVAWYCYQFFIHSLFFSLFHFYYFYVPPAGIPWIWCFSLLTTNYQVIVLSREIPVSTLKTLSSSSSIKRKKLHVFLQNERNITIHFKTWELFHVSLTKGLPAFLLHK